MIAHFSWLKEHWHLLLWLDSHLPRLSSANVRILSDVDSHLLALKNLKTMSSWSVLIREQLYLPDQLFLACYYSSAISNFSTIKLTSILPSNAHVVIIVLKLHVIFQLVHIDCLLWPDHLNCHESSLHYRLDYSSFCSLHGQLYHLVSVQTQIPVFAFFRISLNSF